MARVTHRCPVGDCPARIACEQVMSPPHWRLVPSPLGRALRKARADAGAGSRERHQATRACVEAAKASSEPACDGDLRRMARRFLARHQHPNAINGETWDEEDVTRMLRAMRCHPHKPTRAHDAAGCAEPSSATDPPCGARRANNTSRAPTNRSSHNEKEIS